MTDEREWFPASESPSDGQLVDWMDRNGNIMLGGKYHGRLWFMPPNWNVYVYYEPTFWRPAKP